MTFFLAPKFRSRIENVTSQVRIGNLILNLIGKHKRGPGKQSLTNFQYFFTFRGYPPSQGAWCHGNTVPQCLQMINAYCARQLAQDPRASDQPRDKRRSPSAQPSGAPVSAPPLEKRLFFVLFVVSPNLSTNLSTQVTTDTTVA